MNIKNLDFNSLRNMDIVNILNYSNTSNEQRIVLKKISTMFSNNDEFLSFYIVNAHVIDWSRISRSHTNKIIRQVHNMINFTIPFPISRVVCIASFILNMKCTKTRLRKICPLCI